MNTDRVIKAILIAPLTVFPLVVIPALFSRDVGPVAPIFGLIAVAVSYAGMLVIGVPFMLLLNRYHATRWWQVTLAGAIGAACITWAAGDRLVLVSVYAGAFGAVVAAAAWFIAFRRLPESTGPASTGQPSNGD